MFQKTLQWQLYAEEPCLSIITATVYLICLICPLAVFLVFRILLFRRSSHPKFIPIFSPCLPFQSAFFSTAIFQGYLIFLKEMRRSIDCQMEKWKGGGGGCYQMSVAAKKKKNLKTTLVIGARSDKYLWGRWGEGVGDGWSMYACMLLDGSSMPVVLVWMLVKKILCRKRSSSKVMRWKACLRTNIRLTNILNIPRF